MVAAFGRSTLEKPYRLRKGVMFDQATQSDVFLHPRSQSGTREASPTGQRYIHHRAGGINVLLFVRRCATEAGRTAPYTFLGPVDYVSHRGERPLGITWRVRRPMPADFFREAKVAAG